MLTIHALLDVLKLVNCVLGLVCTIGLVDFLHLILQRRKQRKLYCYRHATHTCDKHGPSTYYVVRSQFDRGTYFWTTGHICIQQKRCYLWRDLVIFFVIFWMEGSVKWEVVEVNLVDLIFLINIIGRLS